MPTCPLLHHFPESDEAHEKSDVSMRVWGKNWGCDARVERPACRQSNKRLKDPHFFITRPRAMCGTAVICKHQSVA